MMDDVREPSRPLHGDAITWFGHACFRVTDAEGHTVIIDPYAEEVMGQSLEGLTADVVIVTHEHADHNNVGAMRTRHVIHALEVVHDHHVKKVGDPPTGLIFTLIPTFHDERNGSARGENVAVVWQEGGVTFCHLGDLGHPLTEQQVKLIGRPDVLMLPIGGRYTIDGREARHVIQQLKPHVVIPMHYQIPGMTEEAIHLSTEEPFLDAGGKAPWGTVKAVDSPVLMIDADHLPGGVEIDLLRAAKLH